MKKYFLIFGIMCGLFITNANAVQSDEVVVQFICPAWCELRFSHFSDGTTYASCRDSNDERCDDPEVVIMTDQTILPVTHEINPTTNSDKTTKVKAKQKAVSARSAETPKMVKKIVYEQVVEDED